MKKEVKKSKHKVILISFLALVLCLLIGLGIYFLFPKETEELGEQKQYYVPNYEEDIFQNKAYMSFQRDLLYGAMGVEQLFNFEKDYESADHECQFFLDYFHTVIAGDYEKLPEFYVEEYFEKEPKFTMQMIYDPYVLFHSTSIEKIDDADVTLLNYHVEYKIFKNNGTFREGVSSNTAIPQIYQIYKTENGSYKIYRILDVKPENDS